MIYQQFNSEQTIIGVYLGGKTLMAGSIKAGQIENKSIKTINNFAAQEHILAELIESIEEVYTEEVSAIGIGVPSLVDVDQGIVYQPLNIPSWHKVYLKQIIEERFGVQVSVNNDANCFALGQKYFGKAQNYSNVVGLVIGVGLGCGIITNNQLYSGRNCGAGEFGSIPYRNHDYEYYCSESFFEKKYGEKYTDFLTRANNGDKIAIALFEHFGNDLGNAIKTILFAIDPEIIVIGGRMAEAFPYFKATTMERIKTFPYEAAISNLKIDMSTDPDIPILGAAALFYNHE